jgi:hypothetical protein
MRRGPLPKKAIAAALRVAMARGLVSLCRRGRDCICDIVLHEPAITRDIMVGMSRRLHGPPAEIEYQFADPLDRFRLVPDNPCRSRELWACSQYGVLRFFRVLQAGLVELDLAGEVLSVDPVQALQGRYRRGVTDAVGIGSDAKACDERENFRKEAQR